MTALDDDAADRMDFAAGLNPQQREAVLYGDGPLLIVAGAGSGKTRVLTHRIAWLVRDCGVSPWSILAITFTNKAANEMRSRVRFLLGDVLGEETVDRMWVATFHSACVRILRVHAERLGYARAFSIYDASDAQRLVAQVVRDLDLDPKRFATRALAAEISNAKNDLLDADAFAASAIGPHEARVADVYREYERRLRDADAMDFDDLLVQTVRLLREHDDVREQYARRFAHVLVDEYQDTNRAQYELARMWSSGSGNLCVVGDSDQSIYAFRGADIRNILEFERDYPDAAVIMLEQNYRSTQPILDAANALINHNENRRHKHLFTDSTGGDLIRRFEADSEHDEAAFVATEIDRLVDTAGVRLGDVAVFYRTNAMSRALEEVLVRSGIGYRVVGGTRFYDRKEIKDALAYLRLLVNPNDEISLRRVINEPRRGIGDQTVARLQAAADARGVPLGAVLADLDDVAGLGPRPRAAVARFAELMTELRRVLDDEGLAAAVEATWERTGYAAELRAQSDHEAEGRLENLQELLAVAHEYLGDGVARGDDEGRTYTPVDELQGFLEDVALVADVDALDATDVSGVTLMTLHNAKGLEFPVVFIVGWEEGVFPHSRSLEDPEELAEERRLAYVGITRAMQRLYLTNAAGRALWGAPTWNPPSRFLSEIPAELCEHVGGRREQTRWTRERDSFRDDTGLRDDTGWSRPSRGRRSATERVDWDGIDEPRDPAAAAAVQGAGAAVMRQTSSHADDAQGGADAVDDVTFAPGDRVRHAKFGRGTVLEVRGSGDKATAFVRFEGGQVKQMMLAPVFRRIEHA